MGQYNHQHTKDWSATIASFDAYVSLRPNTTTGLQARSRMQLIFLYHEWVNKAADRRLGGANGYGRWRASFVMGELQVAAVKGRSVFPSYRFENFSVFKPAPQQEQTVKHHA